MSESGLTDGEKAVLRILGESGLELSPSDIAHNTGYSQDYVRKVCKSLLEEGYVEMAGRSGNPFYKCTELGRELVGLGRN